MAKDSGGRGSPICLDMTVQMASFSSKAGTANSGGMWHILATNTVLTLPF